jgi:hypothetical protein
VDGGHDLSFRSPGLREVIIAEHHNATFRFCQENVRKPEARPLKDARQNRRPAAVVSAAPSPIQSNFKASRRRQ